MKQPNDIVVPVAPDSILPQWGSIERHLTRVLNRIDTGNTVDDIVTRLQTQYLQLWNISDWQALAITQVIVLPQHKVINIRYLVGDGIHTWGPAFNDTMHAFAKYENAKYIEFHGREGWKKLLRDQGYDEIHIVMRRKVKYV